MEDAPLSILLVLLVGTAEKPGVLTRFPRLYSPPGSAQGPRAGWEMCRHCFHFFTDLLWARLLLPTADAGSECGVGLAHAWGWWSCFWALRKA